MFLPLALLAILPLAGLLYEALGEWIDSHRFPAPGKVMNCGGCGMHLNRTGKSGSSVVLESGLAASSLSWIAVQPELAKFATCCSYDRAGFGWSHGPYASALPEQAVRRLHQLLEHAGVPPPYILVGHSFGGLLIRAFAHFYPGEVRGLVFVDPVPLREWANCSTEARQRLRRGARLSRRGAWLARFGVVRATLAILAKGGRRFPQLVARTTAGQGAALMARLTGEVRKLPPTAWPIVRAHWSRPKAFRAMAAHLESLPVAAENASQMPIPPGIPFIVFSADDATSEALRERDEWIAQSAAAKHRRVPGTGHWLHLDRPDLIVQAVRELSQLH